MDANNALAIALAKIINQTGDAITNGVQFLSAQVPDVIHQLLMFKLVQAVVVGIGFGIIGVILLPRAIKKAPKFMNNDDPILFFEVILGFPIGAGCIFSAISYLMDALEIWFVPKVYLIEYASHLISNN